MKQLSLLFLFVLIGGNLIIAQMSNSDFVFKWKTDNQYYPNGINPLSSSSYGSGGIGGDSILVLYVDPRYTYNYDVDWDNDGIFDTLGVRDTFVHVYSSPGTYTVRVRGQYPRHTPGSFERLVAIDQWGDHAWRNVDSMFFYCRFMVYNAVDTPNFSLVNSLNGLFHTTELFNGNINHWDVSNIVSMDYTFANSLFNQPLDNWNTTNLTSLRRTFSKVFTNRPFPNLVFNQSLNNWDVSKVTDMYRLFYYSNYNQPLNNWNTGKVKNMEEMFQGSPFDQPVNSWTTDSVTDMTQMFSKGDFNQPLNNWNVSNVTDMLGMFSENQAFNQDLSAWDVSNVEFMNAMFFKASAFDQDLGDWKLESIGNTGFNYVMTDMFSYSNMSVQSYDSTIIKWSRSAVFQNVNLPLNIIFRAFDMKYCNSITARNDLVINYNWTFQRDSLDCSAIGLNEIAEQKEFSISPNPAQEFFMIHLPETISESILAINIYRVNGQLVRQEMLPAYKKNHKIDIVDLPNGVYIIQFGVQSHKLLVNRN